MNRKKCMAFFILGVALIYFIIGCVPGRPKIKRQSAVTVSDLANNWQNYRVYYAGSAYRPIGILFDPKNDGIKLVGDRWRQVEDEATLSGLVQSVDSGVFPRSIIGRSNNQFYGYYSPTRFTTTRRYIGGHTYHPIAKEIDENTVRVDLNRENFPERDY